MEEAYEPAVIRSATGAPCHLPTMRATLMSCGNSRRALRAALSSKRPAMNARLYANCEDMSAARALGAHLPPSNIERWFLWHEARGASCVPEQRSWTLASRPSLAG